MRRYAALLLALLTLSACFKSPAEEAAVHRQRADEYLAARRYHEASVEYQSALQKWSQDVDSIYGLAQTLEATGQLTEYRQRLREVLALQPDHLPANLEMGGLWWAAGAYDKALELAERVLAAEAASLPGRKLRARALTSMGRREESRAAWTEVLAADRVDPDAYLDVAAFLAGVEGPEAALAIFEEGLSRFPESVELLLAKASLLASDGGLDDAGPVIEAALAVAPENPEVYATQAKYLLRRGERNEALNVLAAARERFVQKREKAVRMAVLSARIYIRLGDLSGSRDLLEAEYARHPGDPQLAAVLADVLIALGRTDRALDLLEVARSLDAGQRTARLLAAQAYLVDGRDYYALRILEGLVAQGDLAVDTHYLYAKALSRVQRWAHARGEYLLVLRRQGDHHLARLGYAELLLQMQEHQAALTQIERLPPGLRQSAGVQLLRVRLLLGQGEAAQARQVVRELRAEAPDNAVMAKLLGDVERAAGRHKRALALYAEAARLSPAAWEPVYARASLRHARRDELKQIIEEIEHYQLDQGEHPLAKNYMASLYLAERDLVRAERSVNQSLLLEPNFWLSRYLLGKIHLEAGDEAKAMVELEGAIQLEPSRPEAYNELAALYQRRGEVAAAEQYYLQLLESAPDEPRTANNLANLYLDQGRVEEGVKYAVIANAGAPRNPHVADTLGWALELSGDSDDAASHLERAAAALPDNATVLLHRAVNLQSLGEGERARPLLQRVLELAPGSALAGRARQLLP